MNTLPDTPNPPEAAAPPQESLPDFVRRSPLWGADDVLLERDASTCREVPSLWGEDASD